MRRQHNSRPAPACRCRAARNERARQLAARTACGAPYKPRAQPEHAQRHLLVRLHTRSRQQLKAQNLRCHTQGHTGPDRHTDTHARRSAELLQSSPRAWRKGYCHAAHSLTLNDNYIDSYKVPLPERPLPVLPTLLQNQNISVLAAQPAPLSLRQNLRPPTYPFPLKV